MLEFQHVDPIEGRTLSKLTADQGSVGVNFGKYKEFKEI